MSYIPQFDIETGKLVCVCRYGSTIPRDERNSDWQAFLKWNSQAGEEAIDLDEIRLPVKPVEIDYGKLVDRVHADRFKILLRAIAIKHLQSNPQDADLLK